MKQVKQAKSVSSFLANTSENIRNNALDAMLEAVKKNKARIISANKKDLKHAEQLVKKGKLTKAMYKRLILDDNKIKAVMNYIRDVKKLKDPVNNVMSVVELDKGLVLEQVSCPIGVITVIFESRPDVVPQVMSLAVKSGNCLVMKGGSEAKNSNRALFDIMSKAAYSAGMPKGSLVLIETREAVSEILELNDYVDLIIPRGSNKFVKHIMDNTKIPVLGHSDGICHVFIDEKADINKAVKIVVDAKTQYPAVCNAMETLLVHKNKTAFLKKIRNVLECKGVELVGCEKTRKIIKIKSATEKDWKTEYGDLKLSIKIVDNIDDAISHINNYGSGHTDSIVTEDKKAAEKFMSLVDSGCVFHNCSTRFSDGFVFGKGAEVGISTNKIHARGPVGVEGLVIYKYKLRGNGQLIATYSGKNAKKYTHKRVK